MQGNGLYRFEFQVNKKQPDGSEIHYCPATLLDSNLKVSGEADLLAYITLWEAIGGQSLYNEGSFSAPACMLETLTPAQAEGR